MIQTFMLKLRGELKLLQQINEFHWRRKKFNITAQIAFDYISALENDTLSNEYVV